MRSYIRKWLGIEWDQEQYRKILADHAKANDERMRKNLNESIDHMAAQLCGTNEYSELIHVASASLSSGKTPEEAIQQAKELIKLAKQ